MHTTPPDEEFGRAAAALLERFERLWRIRDSELIREIVADDGISYWSGTGAIPGREYPQTWRSLVVDSGADLEFEVTGHAAQEPYQYISWHVRASAGDDSVEFDGVDRFRLRGEQADEVYVVFDPGPFADLMQRVNAAGAVAAAE